MFDKELFSIKLSEKERNNEDRLIQITDKIITGLIAPKPDVELSYNYYNCIRSRDRFRYLEDMYGLSNPTSLEFTPLVRRHIDYLVGELLTENIDPKVTCKDFKSLTFIKNEKESLHKDAELNVLKNRLSNNIKNVFSNGTYNDSDPIDEINQAKAKIDQKFISKFEIAAKYIITSILKSAHVDFQNKIQMLFRDYLVTGQCYYRVNMRKKGEMPEIQVYHPSNVFYEKNQNSPYIKDSSKAIVRRYMNYQQILDEYGDDLDADDIEKILNEFPFENGTPNENVYYLRTQDQSDVVSGVAPAMNIANGLFGTDSYHGYSYSATNIIPVYDVEWIEVIKDKDGKIKTERYTTTRIGNSVYVLKGKDDDIVYTKLRDNRASLSINGICNIDRSGKPFSLVAATAALQDKYDLIYFHIDTLIATAGTKGGIVDFDSIPEFLGDDPLDRLAKYQSLRKGGTMLIQSSELNPAFNTIFNGFDDTVNGNSIASLQAYLQQIEYECSSITGVYKESLNKIEQRDAVSNVKVGLKQSEIITKPLFDAIYRLTNHILIDMVNVCKISFDKGFVGSVILNDMNQIFTVDPKHYCFTDYDIAIDRTDSTATKMQKIEAYTVELLKSNIVDAETIINGITAETLTELKQNVLDSIEKKKKENDIASQLQQQNNQLQQQAKELEAQIQKLSQDLEKANNDHAKAGHDLKARELDLKQQEIDNKVEIENKKIDIENNQVKAEVAQLFDDNKNNNEIKNIK